MKRVSFVYLASQSPRRRQLLEQIGVRYELLLAGVDEDVEALETEQPGELPAAYVERVTRAKLKAAIARRAARRLPPRRSSAPTRRSRSAGASSASPPTPRTRSAS